MRYVFAIVALGLLIAFHELGHFVVARLFGVRVNRFTLGFGPPLFAYKKRRTIFSVGAIPLGASVHLHGMNPHDEKLDPEDKTAFLSKHAWKRVVMLASGSLFNYLLALGMLTGMYMHGTHVPVPGTIGAVEPGSPAARAQIRPGDVVLSVEGVPLEKWRQLVSTIAESSGRALELRLSREGREQTVTVVPRVDEHGQGRIGVAQQYVYREHRFGEAFRRAVAHVNVLVVEGTRRLIQLVQGKSGSPLTFATPVTMVRQASQVAATSADAFLRVVIGISVALAVFNLLPFPALDGGRIAFTVIESVTGKRLNPKLETLLHAVGFFLLLGGALFIAWATVRDLRRPPPASHPIPLPARLRERGPQPFEEEELPPTPPDGGIR